VRLVTIPRQQKESQIYDIQVALCGSTQTYHRKNGDPKQQVCAIWIFFAFVFVAIEQKGLEISCNIANAGSSTSPIRFYGHAAILSVFVDSSTV
jgi:hypothetical protein